MFRIETHMHTSESSACATLCAYKQILQYKQAGYDGVIVTDHFINGNSAVDRSLPWKEMMHEQFRGYREACAAGDELGLKVYQGIEYAYHGTEFVVIGLGEDWFANNKWIIDLAPADFIPAFGEAGAAVIQAHPFREASYISEIRLFPEQVDAIEAYNYRNEKEWNDKAVAMAAGYNKPVTAGSDCHSIGECHSGIDVDFPINSTQELINLIKSGKGWKPFEEIKQLN